MAETVQNRVAVVTGGTRGIGRAITEKLLDNLYSVAFCGTSKTTVEAAVTALSNRGNVFGMVADVSKLNEVRTFLKAAHKRFGRIDVLVNNAAIGRFRSVAELDPEMWEQTIGLNLTGTFYCCHEILPIYKTQGGGDIVNISSLAGRNPFAGGAAYNASKFGLNGFSEALMLDHRHDGVRVTTIMPGSVATEFGGPVTGKGDAQAAWKIAPEDIADVVVAWCSKCPGEPPSALLKFVHRVHLKSSG